MNAVLCLRAAALLGGLAVVLGAFGAHGLKDRLDASMLAIFETGVKYQFYHALALLALAVAPAKLWQSALTPAAAWAWIVGVVIFSGSLYILSISGIKWLGAITPIGGVAFIAGWACLLLAAGKMGE